ncbi:branched-chain amino acid ABC transporter permease [Paraburkholderia sp. BCC1886]|uniref:branched-chain amino acid ABC transporter permease n=1 Tax=Paraburkholderia sp. BCC1886 TaxID=2562670 RepID=UPI0011839EA1|nr:branched-chain amino acid ABC transporter permease [Paraburkholderia sp. BCC1886]
MNPLAVQLLQLAIAGLTMGCIYAIVAVGFNVVYKATGAINFAQGEWLMAGGMIASALHGAGWPVWASCVAAPAACALLGWICDRLVMPFVNRSGSNNPFTLTLVTIGVGLSLRSAVMMTLGKDPHGLPGLTPGTVSLAGIAVDAQALWLMGIALAFIVATHLFFEYTLAGRAMRACAAEPGAAALMGVPVERTVSWAFVLAALAGGVAGVIVTPLTFVSYDSGTLFGFKGFAAAMLGGLGGLRGALLGGLLLGLLESFASGLVSSHFRDAVSFVCLLLVLFVRPHGLFGRADIVKV